MGKISYKVFAVRKILFFLNRGGSMMKYNFGNKQIIKGICINTIVIIGILLVVIFLWDIENLTQIWGMVGTSIAVNGVLSVLLFYRYEQKIIIHANSLEVISFRKSQLYPFDSYHIVSLGYVFCKGKANNNANTIVIQNIKTKQNEAFIRIFSNTKKYRAFEEGLYKKQIQRGKHKTAQYDFFFQEAKNEAITTATYISFSLIGPSVKVGKLLVPMDKDCKREVVQKEVRVLKQRTNKKDCKQETKAKSRDAFLLPHISLPMEAEMLVKYRLSVIVGKISKIHDVIVSVNMNYQDIYKIGELNRLFYIIQNKI